MKVRIKKVPQKMAYGGQNKYSLDIVRTTIDDYDPDYNDVERKTTRGADDRGDSTVEVEGGEQIKYPSGELVEAKGPDHNPDPNKEGGVPMNLPEGAFVFSKRKKDGMGVKGAVLKNFGKSEGDKKTYSFAELAKQYNPNKFYDAIVNGAGQLDQITLNTYAANIQRYEDKLADLAILQESKKGFPQGIPDIAKEKFAKMQQYMQQSQEQGQEEQQMPMAMYGYNAGGFVPDYSSVGDTYRYQGGGSTGSQDKQIAQYIQAYAQLAKKDPQEIYQALQSLAPAQQQEALKNIVQTVQQAMSQQQGAQSQYDMQQEQPSEEEAQQMRNGGSYSGTYYQGTYFADGGFVPTYGDSSYNEQFGGQMTYDNDYGMLPKAQVGEQVTNKVTREEFDKKVASGEYVRIPGTNTAKSAKGKMITVTGKVIPGQKGASGESTKGDFTPGRTLQGGKTDLLYTLEDLKARPGKYKTFLENENWKKASPEEQKAALERLRKGRRSTYIPPKPATIAEDGEPTCEPGFTYNKDTKNCEKTVESADRDYIGYDVPQNTPQVPYAPPQPGQPTTGKFGYGNYGIPFESWLGIGAAAAYPPLYLRPFVPEPEAVIPQPTFYDPERELASAQETARGLEQMATIMNPQTAGAMSSFIQSNAAKTAADTIGKYQNLNVGVANQFSPLQAQIYNTLLGQKGAAKKERFDKETIALQQFANAKRQYAKDVASTLGEGIQAGKKLGQLYDTNPYYTTDRFGRLVLKPGVDASDAIMYGTTASRSKGLTPEQYLQRAQQLKQSYPDFEKEMYRDAMRQQYGSGSKRSASDDDDVTYGYAQSAYPFA